nr:uncharacterized protein LOC121129514 [Lepeophtheirus salmonis]
MDHRRKCTNRPLKIITNLFSRGKHKNRSNNGSNNNKNLLESNYAWRQWVRLHFRWFNLSLNGDLELDALHLSRRDNPYLQILNSRECLLSESPPQSFTSPTRSCDPLIISPEIHSHLVRSPPPISWPISPRSGTFSPIEFSSVDGLDEYRRSHSEEHILGSRSVTASMMLSPVRGATPDIVCSSPNYYGGERSGGRHSRFANWRNMDKSTENDLLSPKNTPNDDVGATMNFSVDEQDGIHAYRHKFLSGSRSLISNGGNQFYRSNRASSAVRRDSYWQNQWRNKSDIKSMENLINDGGYYNDHDRKSSFSQSTRGDPPASSSSPRCNRSFYLRKSITLRPKSGDGPIYMDIESQS